jgi:hypothetical protein
MKKHLELKAELARRGWRYRDLARALRERGFDIEADDILAIVAGKRKPDAKLKSAAAEILGRPTFELFH